MVDWRSKTDESENKSTRLEMMGEEVEEEEEEKKRKKKKREGGTEDAHTLSNACSMTSMQ